MDTCLVAQHDTNVVECICYDVLFYYINNFYTTFQCMKQKFLRQSEWGGSSYRSNCGLAFSEQGVECLSLLLQQFPVSHFL